MHIAILSQKMRWFGGKGVDLHPCGPRIMTNDMGGAQRW